MVLVEKNLIRFNDVRVKYKEFELYCQELSISKYDRIGIVGSNGSGKTTLIKALMNLIKYEGEIKRNITKDDVGILMQSNNVSDLYKVKELILLVINKKILNKKLLLEIEKFGLTNILNRRIEHLSGGEQQKLLIFLSIYGNKNLLIFDEITTGLDYSSRNKIINLINDIVDSKKTLLLVSHYFKEIDVATSKIIVIDKGRILKYGNLNKLNDLINDIIFKTESEIKDLSLAKSYIINEENIHLVNKNNLNNFIKNCEDKNIQYEKIIFKSERIFLHSMVEVTHATI